MVNLAYSVNSAWIASVQRLKTSLIPWEAQECYQKGIQCSKGHLLHSIISCRWAGNTGNVVHDFRDEVPSWEEALSQMSASSKMPSCFVQCGRLPSEWSLLPEHQQSNPASEDQMCYCVQVRVTLGEGGGNQPLPPYAWPSSLIADMFQDGLE